jgi:ribose 5-phosphate isomerase B
MTVAVGCDHAGLELKEQLKAWLIQAGHHVLDFGTHSPEPVDYPEYAIQVAESVVNGKAECGLLVCGTGIGMAMAANKIPGVRAAFCPDLFTARLSREHNDANVLALGGRLLGGELAIEILETWLATSFAGGRHSRRIAKIREAEERYLRGREP